MMNILVTASVDGPNNDDAGVFLPPSGFAWKHYGRTARCRAANLLGKGAKQLGKAFAVRRSRCRASLALPCKKTLPCVASLKVYYISSCHFSTIVVILVRSCLLFDVLPLFGCT
jgi:hypothetical protein